MTSISVTHTHSGPLTAVTLVSGVSRAALAAEGAPVGEAGGVYAAGGARRRHTHPVCEPAARGAVHTLTRRRQVVHLRDGGTEATVKNVSKQALCPDGGRAALSPTHELQNVL